MQPRNGLGRGEDGHPPEQTLAVIAHDSPSLRNAVTAETHALLAAWRPMSCDHGMTQKEMVLDTIRELPDGVSVREIADRLEFLAAIQAGLDQLDRGEAIPHEEVKRQLAGWLTR